MKVLKFLLFHILFWVTVTLAQRTSSSSTLQCKKCIDSANVWCPEKDDFSSGQCFSTRSNNRYGYLNMYKYFNDKSGEYSHPGLQLRNQCSDQVDKVSSKFRRTLKYYTCPYQESCGDGQNIIVPPYSSTKKYRLIYEQGKTKAGPSKKRRTF